MAEVTPLGRALMTRGMIGCSNPDPNPNPKPNSDPNPNPNPNPTPSPNPNTNPNPNPNQVVEWSHPPTSLHAQEHFGYAWLG